MTDTEWDIFVASYRRQFIRVGETSEFMQAWRSHLDRFTPDELQHALHELIADPRREAQFHPSRLPLLIDFASHRRERKADDRQFAKYQAMQRQYEGGRA